MVYYELPQPNETTTGKRQFVMRMIQALNEKWPQYFDRHYKMKLQFMKCIFYMMLCYTCTYGFLKIIRSVASGPRFNSELSCSRTCSLAELISSVCGPAGVPSSSTLKRYKKHLSLNGCSWFTVMI